MKKIIIRLLSTESVKESLSFVMSYIDEDRLHKAKKFKQEKDQLQSLGAAYLIKKYLPNKKIEYPLKKKPFIKDGPYFNISHSGKYIVLAIDDEEDVGVDIERIDEKKIEAIKFVSEERIDSIDTNDIFKIWTNKESLIKCRGTGISEIRFAPGLPLEGLRNFCNKEYFTKSLIYDGYSLSLTRKGNLPFEIELIPVNIEKN